MLDTQKLLEIKGGASSLNGTLLNAMTRMFSTLLEVGRAIGSSLRRLYTKSYC